MTKSTRGLIKGNQLNKRPVLLLLSTPPPVGGGEVLNEYLLAYFRNKASYVCLDIGKRKTRKKNQGKLRLDNIINAFRSFAKYRNCIDKSNPKIVYLALPKNFVAFLRTAAFILYARYRKAVVVGELGGMAFYFMKKDDFNRKVGLYFLKKISMIRVLGKQIEKELQAMGIMNTRIVFIGASVPPRDKNNIYIADGHALRFLYVGALAEYKGTGLLIEAFKKTLNKHRHIELHLMGAWHTDRLQKEIMTSISRDHLEPFFHFHGLQVDEKKWRIFHQCHVYVHPSKFEGQPVSIVEALGCGMPIIATRVGGIPDIIEDGVNGYLLDVLSIDELVRRMSFFIDNPQVLKTYYDNNIKAYKEKHTVKMYCELLEKQFEELQ